MARIWFPFFTFWWLWPCISKLPSGCPSMCQCRWWLYGWVPAPGRNRADCAVLGLPLHPLPPISCNLETVSRVFSESHAHGNVFFGLHVLTCDPKNSTSLVGLGPAFAPAIASWKYAMGFCKGGIGPVICHSSTFFFLLCIFFVEKPLKPQQHRKEFQHIESP